VLLQTITSSTAALTSARLVSSSILSSWLDPVLARLSVEHRIVFICGESLRVRGAPLRTVLSMDPRLIPSWTRVGPGVISEAAEDRCWVVCVTEVSRELSADTWITVVPDSEESRGSEKSSTDNESMSMERESDSEPTSIGDLEVRSLVKVVSGGGSPSPWKGFLLTRAGELR